MIKSFKCEDGSTLIFVLILSLILTSTMAIVFAFLSQHARFINGKMYFLTAKNLAESEVYSYPKTVSGIGFSPQYLTPDFFQFSSYKKEYVTVNAMCWGGFMSIKSASHYKGQSYSLNCFLGEKLSSKFQSALLLNTKYSPLVLTGYSQILGDVIVGSKGVQKGTLKGEPFRGSQLVYGSVLKSNIDIRPRPNIFIINILFDELNKVLESENGRTFSEAICDTCTNISFEENKLDQLPVIRVTNGDLNDRSWKVKGPVIFVSTENLYLTKTITFKKNIILASSRSITLDAHIEAEDVIVFSPEEIKIRNSGHISGQFFSESRIFLGEGVKLDYPSLLMVYTDSDTGSITLSPNSEVSGTVCYLSSKDTTMYAQERGIINIMPDAQVNGVVYSDNFVSLQGKVNGTVITDRFYLYYSPTVYFNWIKDGVIDRTALNDEFKLPIFFETENAKLEPFYFK